MFARATSFALRGLRSSLKTPVRGLATRSSIQASHKFSTAFLGAAAVGTCAYLYTLSPNQLIQNEAAPLSGIKGTNSERTFIAVKPDGVQRGLVGEIISRFEKRGYKLVAMKVIVPSKALAKEHYADLSTKPFFGGLVEYMTNGQAPVVAMVWEGLDVIKQGRAMIGATNPLDANAGSIRGDHCISVGRNIIHGSDSYESATKEISLWFGKPGEIVNWTSALGGWIFANN
ncbi:nucleoside diphosphate kinase Ndk1 [Entomophthora muscae]|uniref:Nucleoside diphosphate kinase Ndk1 n=1 Tax=Entomophthora muscae TaxID=34485 RepID=A0ACC2T725_9FUNG|nr:nucleoside diphosphate kinase Ndk1 [Entomophthora muscae]